MSLSASTRQMIRKIRTDNKDPITNRPSFPTDEAVIDFAVEYLYRNLKLRA